MEKIEALKKMGVGDPGGMIKYLDNLDKVVTGQRAIAGSAGALGTGFTTATADAADQFALVHQNLTNLYDAMASPALPWFSARFGELTSFIQGATAASDKYSWATKDMVIGLSVAGVGLGGAASALSTLGMATIGVGNSWKALSYVPALFSRIASAATYFNPIAIAENAIMVATKAWTAAQWLLNLAMDANPIGLAIVGAAALAAIGYEVYEHWSGVKDFFVSFGSWAEGWAKSIGKAVLIGIAGPFGLIAYEIYSHWDSIKAACEKIGSGILSYFEGHSPPKVGPLSRLGQHITIAETIAERIRPAPVLVAIRRTAAAAAIASTAIVAGANGPALAGGGTGAGGGIVINAPITINAGPGSDTAALEKIVVAAFDKHRYELLRALEGSMAQKERTDLK
jgi:hypothetical protein